MNLKIPDSRCGTQPVRKVAKSKNEGFKGFISSILGIFQGGKTKVFEKTTETVDLTEPSEPVETIMSPVLRKDSFRGGAAAVNMDTSMNLLDMMEPGFD